MARWVAGSYLSTTWVISAWYGGLGTLPSVNSWLGAGYLGPRWLSPQWVTNEGEPATTYFGLDSLGVSLGEVGTVVVKVVSQDEMNVSLGETFNLAYTRHVSGFDSLALALAETRALAASSLRSDTLGISLNEAASVGGDLIHKSATDDLDLEILESPIDDIRIESGDALSVSVTETAVRTVALLRSDTLGISLGEGHSIVASGAIVKTASDSLGISLGESRIRAIFDTKSASDTLNIGLDDVSIIAPGAITTYLQGSDSLNLSITESTEAIVAVDTETIVASDTLDVSIDDTSLRIDVVFLFSQDNLNIVLVEAGNIAKASVDPSWEDQDFPWGGATLRDLKSVPIFAKGFDFFQTEMAEDFHGKPIDVVLERLGLTLYGRDRAGNWKEDPDLIKHVSALYPIFRGTKGTIIRIFVGSQDSPEDAVDWEGPFNFIIGESRFVDPIVSGRYIAVRFESSGQKPWQLLSYDLDIKPVGRGV